MKGHVNWGEVTQVATFDHDDDRTLLGMLVGIAEWLRAEVGECELLSIANHGETWQVVYTTPKDDR